MKEYFTLQFYMTNRKFKDFGLEPIFAYLLVFAAFIGASLMLFSKTEFAQYLYVLFALGVISRLSEKRRNDFLITSFTKTRYRTLRIIENLLLALPFLMFLLYQQLFLSAVILLVLAMASALKRFNTNFNYTIPTPFAKHPFEFVVGFRNTFFLYPFTYLLTGIAIHFGNFNLGIFSMMLVFLFCISYYAKPEHEFYVWSFGLNPHQFISKKLLTALLFATLLSLPIAIALGFFFQDNITSLLLFYGISAAMLVTVILAKYSAYPDEMSIAHAFMFALSIYLPILLLLIIPYLYVQSTTRLKYLLQ